MDKKGKATLSAMPYIKGNKKRIRALVISLSMFVVLSYGVSYILACCMEPFEQACSEPYRDMLLTSPHVVIDEYETVDEWSELATKEVLKCAAEIEKIPGITGTLLFREGRVRMKSVVGETSLPCFLMDSKEDVKTLMDYKGAKLVSGRLPEAPGEILVDEKLAKNMGDKVLEYMSDRYYIVGQCESDYYLAMGMALSSENDINLIVFHPDDGKDYGQMIKDTGIEIYYVMDYESQHKGVMEDVGSLLSVERLIQLSCGIMLAICLLVVLSLHIMDRHEEWCLMNSIGFSSGEIYSMALRELLFCFVMAFGIGVVFSAAEGIAFDKLLCAPIGVHIDLFRKSTIPVVIGVMTAIYGCAQIPLFVNIRKVCTVDAIE